MRIVAGLFFAHVLLASPAFGADAFVVGSGVMVNPGDGYRTVTTRAAVQAGDQVIANETGQGWIVYCGCDVELRPSKVYTVEERNCEVETVSVNRSNWPHVVLPGGEREEQELRRCGGRAPIYLLGGAAIACAAAECFEDDGKGGVRKAVPVSP